MVSVLTFVVMLSLVGVVSFLILLAVPLAMPLAGAVVRLRANYNPKGLQLDPEAREQPRTTGPAITFSAMLARVFRFEGWPGLYKGLMPTLLSIPTTATLFLLRLMGTGNLRFSEYSTLSIGVVGSLAYTLLAVVILPLMIIVNRAITTPHKLPCFHARDSLSILLTHEERQRPWILYQTPGLVAAEVSRAALLILGFGLLRRSLLLGLNQPDPLPTKDISGARLAISLVLALAGTVVLTPLEVISIRLAIQHNRAAPEPNLVPREYSTAQDTAEYTGIGEDVISLRTEQAPYSGLLDWARKIVEEEGWGALYRAWWWTMLGLIFI